MAKTIDTFGYIFKFGKHKGATVEYVISCDPSYILWLADETDIEIIEEIIEAAQNVFDDDTFGN